MLFNALLLWLAASLCLAAAQQRGAASSAEAVRVPVKTHSLAPPFLDSEMQSRWFDYGGDTIVRADKYIRLASDMASRAGWLFSKIPLTVSNWQIEVEFQIHGQGNLHGDGMAMWITKNRGTQGPVFGSTDKFEGLGIFFDVYKNNRPGTVFPFVMAMLGDGQTSYSKETDGRDQELASCSARGLRGANIPTKARLTYYQDESLKLELQYKSEGDWTECFTLGAVALPSVSYLGFSAETGELSDNFDILRIDTWNLYEGDGPRSNKAAAKPEAKRPPKASPKVSPKAPPKRTSGSSGSSEGPSWGWTLLKIALGFAVLGGGYVGYTAWRASKRSRFD